jgi:putative Holliday junction resolvase
VALEIYFSLAGEESELVLPKNLDYKKKLQRGPRKDIDFFSEEFEG